MTLQIVPDRPVPQTLLPVPVEPERLTLRQQIIKFLQPRTSPDRAPNALTTSGTGMGGFGIVAQNTVLAKPMSPETWRAYARTPWVFAALNIRKDQVSAAEWDIVPFDNEKRFPARQRDALRELFNQPSAKIDSFQSFAKVVIGELLILDAAPIEKVRYPNGEIAELWPTRGDWVQVDERWDGSDPDKVRYYWVPDGTLRATLRNDDMIYMVANQRDPASSIGVSPLSVLQTVIESELQALEYNRKQVMGAAPDGVLNIGESAGPEDVQKAQSKFSADIFGQGAMAVIGGYKGPSWMPFRTSNRDMQFREWEDLLIRCIAITLGLAPMDLGITFDVNRSTAEQGAQNTEDRGLKPLMSLFQNFMTREVVWDRSFGGKANNLAFKFTDLTLDETLAKANINKIALGAVGWKPINEARHDSGRAPLGDPQDKDNIFNHVLTNTPKGMLDLTTGEYLGEQALADIQSKAKVDVAQAVADANPQQPTQTEPTPKQASFDDLLQKAISPFIDRQDRLLDAVHAVANRPIEVHVQSAPAPNVEVHPAEMKIAEGAVQVNVPPIELHPAQITVAPAPVTIEKGAVQITMPEPKDPPKRKVKKTPQRDADGRISSVIEEDL